jgi:hypothetical protein
VHSGLTDPTEFTPALFLLVALVGSSLDQTYVLGHLAKPSNDLGWSTLSFTRTEAHTELVGPSPDGSFDPNSVEATRPSSDDIESVAVKRRQQSGVPSGAAILDD